MPATMTKRERLAATIAGRPVDRLPVALWRHFFVEETTAEGLAAAMVRWQETYDWDFLKINPRASYHVEDWGNRYAFSGNPLVEPTLVRACVHTADDFRHLDRLDPKGKAGRSAPVLAEHLAAVAAIRRALGPDVPLLMTVFTPMSIAADLAGGPQDLAALIAQGPAMVHAGLRTITETFAGFAARCLDAGADGIFLATTHCATPANFTLEQYQEFGRPYDLQVLAAVRPAPLNLLHVCRARSLVRQLADYPVALLNWDTAGEGNPTLAEMAAAAPGKGLVGGLDRAFFTQGPPGREALLSQARETSRAMAGLHPGVARPGRGEAGRPFVLASTCAIDTASDPEAVRAVRKFVEQKC